MIKTCCAAVLLMGSLCLGQGGGAGAGGVYGEKLRPQFHFTAKTNWLNDPNGLVFAKGEYHLFFQHNPSGINWGNMTWGHAVSSDLVHWKQLEHAIVPDELGTIFSGSAVVDANNTAGFGKDALVTIYTAAGGTNPASKGKPFTQCIAYSTDGRGFTKFAGNPVLKHIAAENRDPKVVWHEPSQRWIMALYLDRNDYALFSSPNLKEWKQLQTVTMAGCSECPDFFPMKAEGGEKWVFTSANGRYLVGDFDGQKFTPDSPKPRTEDWGRNYYAVQTYSNMPDGRRVQVAWMRDGKYPGMPFNQQMSFPCELTLKKEGDGWRLCRMPVKEIEKLRGKVHEWRDVELGKDPLGEVKGDLFEVQMEVEANEATELRLGIGGATLSWSGKDPRLACLGAAPRLEPEGGKIRLEVLIDRTSIEAFGNDGVVSETSCFLPKEGAKALELGGVGKVSVLRVYELKSAWAGE